MNVFEQKEISAAQSFLSFRLGKEIFAVEVSKVNEILEVPKITKIPKSPEYMTGVINLRGTVLPLVDTKIKFGMKPVEFTVDTCIVVLEIKVEDEKIQVGALVDSVLEVMEINEAQLQPSPSMDAKYNLDFIEGMLEVDNKFIMLLKIDMIFSINDIIELKETHDGSLPKENKSIKNPNNRGKK